MSLLSSAWCFSETLIIQVMLINHKDTKNTKNTKSTKSTKNNPDLCALCVFESLWLKSRLAAHYYHEMPFIIVGACVKPSFMKLMRKTIHNWRDFFRNFPGFIPLLVRACLYLYPAK